MSKFNLEEAKGNLDAAVQVYIDEFCRKHGVKLREWYGPKGWIAEFEGSNAMLTFADIRFDLETNQPKGLIFEWNTAKMDKGIKANFKSYCRGLRL